MKRARRGSMVLETALWIPVLVLLISGIIQFGKITYIYYTLRKTVYTAAAYLAQQQGTNFCDLTNDANAQAALNFAVTGTADGSGPPLVSNLTPAMLQVTVECVDPSSGVPAVCQNPGCGGDVGAQRPDYIVVSIPGGFPVQPRIPFITLQPVALAPTAAAPFGGVL
jgi:Flp pilus assembly protein TadG